ncbi:class I SAM-dependent methyltransferase [Bacillus changyiensis]|uniref:class I SAM-dependent methyltransferase n=1 Tax=Bacillus changyiensis TaxID=3004103 RepID=UPI0022E8ED21|nr:class I SAM-dependent methyltransferase [Bacillus changyiensis]MDA1477638.1 methyltransferase domain-containing protein [Bacillus changyiensis]
MNVLEVNDLKKMNYNQLISIIGETNRPPGGIKTIINFVNTVHINENHKVLEIGTSTGFTAIELAKMTNCQITAVDINEESLKIAQKNADRFKVEDHINFVKADATNLPFDDEEFDFIFAGNIISYIPDRKKALSEYKRVLKYNGVLLVAPMFYVEVPSNMLIEKIRDALKMNIKIDYEDYWDEFFTDDELDIYLANKYKFDYITDQHISDYVEEIFRTNENIIDHNIKDVDSKNCLKDIYIHYIYLFRDNLHKMAYKEMYIRKNKFKFDRELFTSTYMKGCDLK